MNLNKSYAQTNYNVTFKPGRTFEHIVIHNTGTMAGASNNCRYFGGGNRNASADFFVDRDGEIFQFNADLNAYYSWHCRSGNASGINNENSIGIECVSDGCEFSQEQREAVKELIVFLRTKYGNMDIVRHYDATGKSCPAYYVNESRWCELKNYLESSNSSSSQDLPSGSFLVKVLVDDLNYRSEPSMNGRVLGQTGKSTFTIVETRDGWGKLKSGAGWIYLENPEYVQIIGDALINQAKAFETYKIKVTCSALNVRKGPGTDYGIVMQIKKNEVYTIIEESGNWGKLKSGAGWICLDYAAKM